MEAVESSDNESSVDEDAEIKGKDRDKQYYKEGELQRR